MVGPAGEAVAAADVHRCVLQILRTGLTGVGGGGVMLGMLNSMGEMLGEVPEVVEALHGEPAEHVWFWGQVLAAWDGGDVESGWRTLVVLDGWHTEALQRLRLRLDARGT